MFNFKKRDEAAAGGMPPALNPSDPSTWPTTGQPISPAPPKTPRRPLPLPAVRLARFIVPALIALSFVLSLTSHNSGGTSQPTPSGVPEPDPELVADTSTYHNGVVQASGTIRNLGSIPTSDVVVTVSAYVGSQQVGSGHQDLGSMDAGESRSYSFAVTLSSNPSDVDIHTDWTWDADRCPPGNIPSANPTDSTVQDCLIPSR